MNDRMNDQPVQAQKFFLIGIIVLGVMIVVGLIWAMSLGPDAPGSNTEQGLSFSDDNDPAMGPGDAKVVVRLFSDFQCPACRSAEAGVRHALDTYKGRVRFVWNDFPLTSIHRNAKIAANAGRCAQEQGKFWEYADQLYMAQPDWAELAAPSEKFADMAGKLGLNKDAFSICVAHSSYDRKVEDDMSEGRSNRVDSTPTYFINDKRYVGGMSAAEWDTAISAALDAPAS